MRFLLGAATAMALSSVALAADDSALSTKPRVLLGELVVKGALDKEIIRSAVNERLPRLVHFYQQALRSSPEIEGQVEVRFMISPTGSVVQATVQRTTLWTKPLEERVLQQMRQLAFPRTCGGVVIVEPPIVFRAPERQRRSESLLAR